MSQPEVYILDKRCSTVYIIDYETGAVALKKKELSDTPWNFALSPSGHHLAVAHQDLSIYDAHTLDGILADIGGIGNAISVVYSSDGLYLAIGDVNDYRVRLLTTDGYSLIATSIPDNDWVRCLAFSPSCQVLASGFDDQTTLVWSVPTLDRLYTLLGGHVESIRSIVFTSESIAVTASFDKAICVWDLKTGNCANWVEAHTDRIWAMAISPDKEHIATSSGDHVVKIYEAGSLQCILEFDCEKNARSLCFLSNGTLLAALQNESAKVYDIHTGDVVKAFGKFIEPISIAVHGFADESMCCMLICTRIRSSSYQICMHACSV